MKRLKKGEITIYAIALMLVAAGYFNYTTFNNEQIQETYSEDVSQMNNQYSNTGDAVLVSNNEVESKDKNDEIKQLESLINEIDYDNKYLVETVEEACEVANKVGNNIFIGTGSKNLSIYKELIKNKNLITRVLPTSEVLISCENLGFNADNIIAMKGPFTQEMNESTYKQYDIDLVITKESGIAGGFLEKVNACKTLNIPVVIIKRKEMNYPNTIGNIEKLIDLINIY